MPWTWRYEKADGAVVSGTSPQEAIFGSQGDAESWLVVEELARASLTAVSTR